MLHALLQANKEHLTAHGDYRAQVAASLAAVATELADLTKGQWRFGIFLHDELIGRADLIPVDPPRYGLGYWLARDAIGNGYGSAAVAALLSLAADSLHATEIYAGVTHGNERSRRLLFKLGFDPVADFDTYTRFCLKLRAAGLKQS